MNVNTQQMGALPRNLPNNSDQKQVRHGAVQNPQGQAVVERFHRTLLQIVRAAVDDKARADLSELVMGAGGAFKQKKPRP